MLDSTTQLELLELPPAPVPTPKFNQDLYTQLLEESGKIELFNTQPTYANAKALSYAIIDAVYTVLTKDNGVVINSSTGKDSTLMASLVVERMLDRQAKGLPLVTTTIAISDTASEFPEMAIRMRTERDAINKFAQKHGLPLTCILVGPPPKNRLLVEILGNGKPLPKISSGQSKSGLNAATWCMQRVKKGPLDRIVQEAENTHSFFVQGLGVRSAESAHRAKKMAKYAGELPYGLTKLGEATNRIGLTPIAHWDDTMLLRWMQMELVPWDIYSLDRLSQIYMKGSAGDLNAKECPLSIGKDNQISNSCGDLSGTRFGCWMCVLSTNKSLQNTARKDPRYRWLRNFHTQLYAHHENNTQRVKDRNAAKFTGDTLFPKTFTFTERYRLLVFLFRAEIESGFTLLEPEDIAAIKVYWEKAGIYTFTPEDARTDAKNWKATGKMRFLPTAVNDINQTLTIGTAVPMGAFFHLNNPGFRSLDVTHLLAFAPATMTVFPTLQAHLFQEKQDGNNVMVLVTDTPSVIGTITNTGLLNGVQALAWDYIASRETTAWERQLSNGRSFYYLCSKQEMWQACNSPLQQKAITPLASTFLENLETFRFNGMREELAEYYMDHRHDHTLIGKISTEQFKDWYHQICTLTDATDCLEETARKLRQDLLNLTGGKYALLQTLTPEGEGPEGIEMREKLKKYLKKENYLAEALPLANEVITGLKTIARAIQRGEMTAGVINDIAYIARTSRYDENYTEELLLKLVKRLDIKKAA